MKLNDYCDAINAEMHLTRYANQNRWCAKFDRCEVATQGCLESVHGNGLTPEAAMTDYIQRISGKRIVFNAMTAQRREFTVPIGIEL